MLDLFSQTTTIFLPSKYAISGHLHGNPVRQVETVGAEALVQVSEHTLKNGSYFAAATSTGLKVAISENALNLPKSFDGVVRVRELAGLADLGRATRQRLAHWSAPRPPKPTEMSAAEMSARARAVRESWVESFHISEERYEGDTLVSKGLRQPQVGALHAVKAHWIVSSEPATVVMPTGTGKTETMLALLASERIERLLVVVPTDALREQISNKFLTMGELKAAGVLRPEALLPIVAAMKRCPKTAGELESLLATAQVLVATMQSVARLSGEFQDLLAERVTHLFIDEAHHIAAKTWKAFKRRFAERKRPIVQFTATPYRTDERRIDGKFVFVYPLRRAQEQNLFRPVRYVPVYENGEELADLSIIAKVGEALDRDAADGFDHRAMARTNSVERAERLAALYRKHLPRHPAAVVHSKLPAADKARALDDLRDGRIRIIVCVDMLGEGFDLPRLKVAGLHDPHKSEAITFQFVGRFTRSQPGLGDATVVARVSLGDPHQLLNALYREDADWNHLLRLGSASMVARGQRREHFYGGLDSAFETIPYDAIMPRLSTFVFRTHCARWDPHNLAGLERKSALVVEGPIVNDELAFAMTVLREEGRLKWARVNHPTDIAYRLVMAHWDEEQGLLYVHSTSDSAAMPAARLVAGDDVEALGGEAVFRVLHGFRNVMLNSLGVKETQAKPVRFQFSTGINITEELEATADNRRRVKTNLYGTGYVDETVVLDDGETMEQAAKRGIGCSTKGKIWSQDVVTDPGLWIEWCRSIGPKIADESIGTEAVLRNVMRPRRQTSLPAGKVPLAIEWPESLTVADENRVELVFADGGSAPMSQCEIEIADYSEAHPIRFRLRAGELSADYLFNVRDSVASYKPAAAQVLVRRSNKERSIEEMLLEDPPAIRFADGDVMFGADLAAIRREDEPAFFDAGDIVAVDWTGVEIRAESQGPHQRQDSIQRRVIETLLASQQPYDLVFDGDASGEVADVVAVRRQGRDLDVELYHCKFSGAPAPGARIGDLYEVCGQAMKSVRWADPRSRFLQKMRDQEERRVASGSGMSRIQKGNRSLIDEWMSDRRQMRWRFSVTIVQPGYSKRKAAAEHMPMLGSVRAYLMSTYGIGFSVWASA
jgi:superfamily II DNA or RNA helicase